MMTGFTSHLTLHFLQTQIVAVQCHHLPLSLTRFRPKPRHVKVCELWYFHAEYKGDNPGRKVQSLLESIWNVMAHGDAREGKWRGNCQMQWVASTLHTTSEHGVSSVITADAHNSAASSRLKLTPPDRFKWTRPFRPKDEIWFLRACHHISNALYTFPTTYLKVQNLFGVPLMFLSIFGVYVTECVIGYALRRTQNATSS